MTNAMKKHIDDYKADLKNIPARVRYLPKSKQAAELKKITANCTTLWDRSAAVIFGKTLEELETIVKEQDNAN